MFRGVYRGAHPAHPHRPDMSQKAGRLLLWLYAFSLSPRETFSSHLRSIYKSWDAT
jgi:hypothetical protein